jgi:hypothetical protein
MGDKNLMNTMAAIIKHGDVGVLSAHIAALVRVSPPARRFASIYVHAAEKWVGHPSDLPILEDANTA